jgi:hypothetical protein
MLEILKKMAGDFYEKSQLVNTGELRFFKYNTNGVYIIV